MQRHGYYLAIMLPQWSIDQLRGLRKAEVDLILQNLSKIHKHSYTRAIFILSFHSWFSWDVVFKNLYIGILINHRLLCSQEIQEFWCDLLDRGMNYVETYKAMIALDLINECLSTIKLKKLEEYYRDLGNEVSS